MARESTSQAAAAPNGRARDFLRMLERIRRDAEKAEIDGGVLATGFYLGQLEKEWGTWGGMPARVLEDLIRLLRVTVRLSSRRSPAA